MQNNTLYIVDDDSADIPKDSLVVFLNEDSDKFKNKLPLLEDFNKNQSFLRNELLKFNDSILNNLKKYLDKDEDYKYLLSSLIFEKSPYKTDYVYNFFKVTLIIKYINDYTISNIVFNSRNKLITNFLEDYAISQKINYNFLNKNIIKFNFKNYVMSSKLLSLGYILKREFKKIQLKIKKNQKTHNKLIVSYFPNYKFNENEEFISNYFSDMTPRLNSEYDWLFIYANDIKKINEDISILELKNFKQYNFLDAYFTLKDFFSLIKKYYNIVQKINKINITNVFLYEKVNYKELIWNDWKKSLAFYLIDTLVYEYKFHNFFKNKAYSDVLYLLEYQPWEQMLNKTLKYKKSFVRTNAITHSIFRPNLMNYYYSSKVHEYMYTSNVVAANSDFSKKMLISNGYESQNVIEIEAQRFNYLSKIEKFENFNNLLIITSINLKETETLLRVFSKAIKEHNLFDNIFIKPHPFMPIDGIISSFDFFPEYEILNCNMDEALKQVSTIVVTNSSSTLLESIMYGKKTITLFSLDTLPMPSIEEHRLLYVVTSSKQLEKVMLFPLNDLSEVNNDLIYINSNYQKWNKFLGAKNK